MNDCNPSDAFLVDRIHDQTPAKCSGVDILVESMTEHCDVSIMEDAIYSRYVSIDKETHHKGARVTREHADGSGWHYGLHTHSGAGVCG